MHKGRRYPFLPQFWHGWAYFWPGFLPWKFYLTYAQYTGPGYPAMGILPSPIVSEPCVVLSATEVQYSWPVTWNPLSDLLQLTVIDEVRFGVCYSSQKMTLSLGGVEIQSAWQSRRSPIFDPEFVGAYWYANVDEDPPFVTGAFDMYPALYGQGGSPWSL